MDFNLDKMNVNQMQAGAAAIAGDGKDYDNTQDVEGK